MDDIRRSHMYLRDVVERCSIPVFTDIQTALHAAEIVLQGVSANCLLKRYGAYIGSRCGGVCGLPTPITAITGGGGGCDVRLLCGNTSRACLLRPQLSQPVRLT